MYSLVLTLHSLVRWLVLASLLYSAYHSFRGWVTHKPFTKADNKIRQMVVTLSHLQFTIGLVLYAFSPIVRYFITHFNEGLHNRDARFFGMEHITMMVIAVTLITVGALRSKRKQTDREKFKTQAIWYSIALIIIFLSIPWPFSPFTARPYWRF